MSPAAVPFLLLVEDDQDDILFMKRAFKEAGLGCPHRVVSDGLEAIEYLEGRSPYADRSLHPLPTHILLDLKLPRKSGLEILAWIREHPTLRSLRVSVLTSSTESDDIARAKKLGIDEYLVKPVRYNDLLILIRQACETWKLGQPASRA